MSSNFEDLISMIVVRSLIPMWVLYNGMTQMASPSTLFCSYRLPLMCYVLLGFRGYCATPAVAESGSREAG